MAIYMQVDGIDGNVTATGHEKWIELGSMNFGVGRGVVGTSPGKQSNREASTPSFSEITVTKDLDETSPLIFSEACIGKTKKVTIHFCQTGDSQIKTFLEYVLTDVLFSGYSVNGSGGNSHPRETLSLNFSKIQVKYTPYKEDHSEGTPVPAGYDLSKGTKI